MADCPCDYDHGCIIHDGSNDITNDCLDNPAGNHLHRCPYFDHDVGSCDKHDCRHHHHDGTDDDDAGGVLVPGCEH